MLLTLSFNQRTSIQPFMVVQLSQNNQEVKSKRMFSKTIYYTTVATGYDYYYDYCNYNLHHHRYILISVDWCREKLLAEKDEELVRLKDDVKNLETERSSLISKVSQIYLLSAHVSRHVCWLLLFIYNSLLHSDLVTNAVLFCWNSQSVVNLCRQSVYMIYV